MKGGKWGYRLPENPLFARVYRNILDVYGLTWKGNKKGYLVPRAGLEPARDHSHCPLKTACLPVPPPRREIYVSNHYINGKVKAEVVRVRPFDLLPGNQEVLPIFSSGIPEAFLKVPRMLFGHGFGLPTLQHQGHRNVLTVQPPRRSPLPSLRFGLLAICFAVGSVPKD